MKPHYLVTFLLFGFLLPSGFARDKLVPSKFDRDHREQRDERATSWSGATEISRTLSTAKLDQKVALFLEQNRDGSYRAVLRDFPRSKNTWSWETSISEEELLRRTETYKGGGVKLLFAHESDSGSFTAIWIPDEHFEAFSADLENLGITPAEVQK